MEGLLEEERNDKGKDGEEPNYFLGRVRIKDLVEGKGKGREKVNESNSSDISFRFPFLVFFSPYFPF